MSRCCDEAIDADDLLIKSCRQGGRIKIRKPNLPIHNAHHHPPGTTTAEAKLFEVGRVNDDVRSSL